MGDGAFTYWLQKADDLPARSVRIFAGVPGENCHGEGNNIQPANIYAFAKAAQQVGLRVGIVIHNSTDFTMTPAKE